MNTSDSDVCEADACDALGDGAGLLSIIGTGFMRGRSGRACTGPPNAHALDSCLIDALDSRRIETSGWRCLLATAAAPSEDERPGRTGRGTSTPTASWSAESSGRSESSKTGEVDRAASSPASSGRPEAVPDDAVAGACAAAGA
eukprot:6182051-Pleurochrysis_carterae.AAC.2